MWKRKGLITDDIKLRHRRFQCPVVDTQNDGFWRIYYSFRDGHNRSHTTFFDVEPGYPENILDQPQHLVKYKKRAIILIFSFHFCNHLLSCTFWAYYVVFILNKAFSNHRNLTGCAKEAFVMPSQRFEGNEPSASKSTLTYFNGNKQNKGVSPCSPTNT